MPILTLFPFRFFDLVTRRWHRARYVGTIEDITARHAAVQIIGAPELREVADAFEIGQFPAGRGIRGTDPVLDADDTSHERSDRE